MLASFKNLENMPGMGIAMGYITDALNEYAADHYNVKDPYRDEKTGNRLKLPEGANEEEKKIWKNIQKTAFAHDRCPCSGCLGCCVCCCGGGDIGLGYGPLVSLFPGFGPFLMYALHTSLVIEAEEYFSLPISLEAKLHSNILFDLVITLVPVLGSLFSWLSACSTRNAILLYNHMANQIAKRQQMENQNQNQNHNNNINNNINHNNINHNNTNGSNINSNVNYTKIHSNANNNNNGIDNSRYGNSTDNQHVQRNVNKTMQTTSDRNLAHNATIQKSQTTLTAHTAHTTHTTHSNYQQYPDTYPPQYPVLPHDPSEYTNVSPTTPFVSMPQSAQTTSNNYRPKPQMHVSNSQYQPLD